MLAAENLRLVYRDGAAEVAAVDGVSLSIAEREFVGIVGPSGSGKSSLLYLLAGLKRATSGSVGFRGRPLGALAGDAAAALRRRHFGFVFQNPFLVGYLTALENVLVAAPAEIARADGLLERLGIAPCRDKFPHQMSMGEKQRVAIARALLPRPAIVFADEPTASLDRANADLAVKCLRETAREGALFVVTHDESILRGADRVLLMRAGVVVRGES
jgi:putative ABC transport system ATP-binding protein